MVTESEVREFSSIPTGDCQHCGQRTEFIVEFRDLASDESWIRSLCRQCALLILGDI